MRATKCAFDFEGAEDFSEYEDELEDASVEVVEAADAADESIEVVDTADVADDAETPEGE